MKILKLPSGKSKAQAMLEFAIVLPILLLVVYGLIETGRLLFIYSSVNNATRQAARYGSTSGIDQDYGVPRYQACAGIRDAAQRGDFLNAFDDDDIDIFIDNGIDASGNPINQTLVCTGGAATDTSITPQTGDRITVNIDAAFNAIVPNLVPFISQTIDAESSRTLLLTISVQPPKENTTTLITADTPDPSQVGQPVTVSVTVTANTTPTGTVNITGADSNCSITLSNGSGSCIVNFSSIGSKTITATYAGDSGHNPSSDTENHTVVPATTITEITADTPEPSYTGGTVTVAVRVSSQWGGIPSGTVSITGADTNCTITLSSGIGNCNINFTSEGLKTITATYNGSATLETSSDTEDHEVLSPTRTITTITSDSPDPSVVGQAVTVAVAVTGSTTPTGTVDITGADTNCTITLSGGTGSCTVVFNSLGSKTLTATYNPATIAHAGSSDTEAHSVQRPPSVITITSATPDPSSIGQAVNVVVQVTGGATTPTGTVDITGADTNCTITLSGGTGNCNIVFNSNGAKTIRATYNGSSSYSPSSTTEPHTVTTVLQPIPNCSTLPSATNPSVLRQVGGNMTINITNPFSVALQISSIRVTWNHDKGHQTGSDKTLRLTGASLGGSNIWTATGSGEIGPDATFLPQTGGAIPPNTTSTLAFIFHHSFDRWDNTEIVEIFFANPGCGSVVFKQTIHE